MYYFDCSHWSDHWKEFETEQELMDYYNKSQCPNKIAYKEDENGKLVELANQNYQGQKVD